MSREYKIILNEKETEIIDLALKTLKNFYMNDVDYHLRMNNIGNARSHLVRMTIIDDIMLKLIR